MSSNTHVRTPSYPPPTHNTASAPSYPSPMSYQNQNGHTNDRVTMPVAQPYRGEKFIAPRPNDLGNGNVTIAPPINEYSRPHPSQDSARPLKGAYTNAQPIPTSNHTPSTTNPYADPQFSFHPTAAREAQTSARIAADQPLANESREERELDEEEEEMLRKGAVDWKAMKTKGFWFKKEYIKWYVGFIVIVVLVGLMAIFHTRIIKWLQPFVNRLRTLTGGWLIPIAIITVLSFPPLFGQEIVIVLVGLIWGLGEGFGITAAGTILGEILNFVVFKYACRARAEKIEHKSLNYACLSRVLRDGGFLMCWVSRLSAIPTHVTTTIFSVCGFSFWVFLAAMVASLPKQLIAVYVGVVLGRDTSDSKSKAISDSVFAATAVVTIGALWWIYIRMNKVRIEVWREHREYLRAKGVSDGDLPSDVDANGSPVGRAKEGGRRV